MATTFAHTKYKSVIWTLTASQNGDAFEYAKLADKTVQMFGTFGGTVTMQGSNDPRVVTDAGNAVWSTLTDNNGGSIALTAAGMRLIAENPTFIRPSVGVGVTAVTIAIQATE